MAFPRAFAAAAALCWCSCAPTQADLRFRAPAGFTVERATSFAIPGRVSAFTFDSLGRPVIALGAKHPVTLADNDGDGVFDTARLYSDKVNTVSAMWFDGRVLYASGKNVEGQSGLYRLEDTDGDDAADTFELVSPLEARAIRRGPDGHPVVLESAAGSLSRFQTDRRSFTPVASGLHHPSGLAFDAEGEMLVLDGDEDGRRLVHVIPGADYGLRSGHEAPQPDGADVLPALRETGGRAGVGLEFYLHPAYPEGFRHALFTAGASGSMLVDRLSLRGASYQSNPAVLLEGSPERITSMETGPDGFIYFAAAQLYRIRYRPSWRERLFGASMPVGALAAARQPQPLSSWGHARLLAAKESMMAQWGPDLEKLARDPGEAAHDRIQALFLLQRFGPKPNAGLLRPLASDKDSRVRAAAFYVVGQHGSPRAKAIAVSGLKDTDPFARRRAAEAIVRMGLDPEDAPFAPVDDVYALLKDRDRFTRWAGRIALERTPREEWRERALRETDATALPEGLLAVVRTAPAEEELEPVYETLLEWLKRPEGAVEDRVRLLRVFQVAASRGTLRDALRRQFSDLLIGDLHGKDERLNAEAARTLVLCGQPGAIEKVLDAMEGGGGRQTRLRYARSLRSMEQALTPGQRARFRELYSRLAREK